MGINLLIPKKGVCLCHSHNPATGGNVGNLITIVRSDSGQVRRNSVPPERAGMTREVGVTRKFILAGAGGGFRTEEYP